MRATILVFATLAFAGSTLQVSAQHAGHAAHQMGQAVPQEPGNGAFAAIAEIVALLADDPATDWDKVDIDALRVHLVDMNALVLGANVSTDELADGLRMTVDGTGRAGVAAARMVPAHGPVLLAETGWSSAVETIGPSIVWTVQSTNPDDAVRIKSLGFFGLMAVGDHHRQHHLAIARGSRAH